MLPLAEHLSSHLHELRQRLLIAMLAILICSAVAYFFVQPIAEFLIAPLFLACPDLKALVYTNLTEAFFSYITLAILIGVGCSMPVLIYQGWGFVAPGLHENEKATLRGVVFLASGLFVGGVFFAYWLVLPKALVFLMSFARQNLTPMPKFGDYLTFMARTGLAFGLAFEIPFLMIAAAKAGVVTKFYFKKNRLYCYLAIFGLSFLLTAGDPFSAMLLTIPLIGLYEVGVLIVGAMA